MPLFCCWRKMESKSSRRRLVKTTRDVIEDIERRLDKSTDYKGTLSLLKYKAGLHLALIDLDVVDILQLATNTKLNVDGLAVQRNDNEGKPLPPLSSLFARILIDDQFWAYKFAKDFKDITYFVGSALPSWITESSRMAPPNLKDSPWLRYYYVMRWFTRQVSKGLIHFGSVPVPGYLGQGPAAHLARQGRMIDTFNVEVTTIKSVIRERGGETEEKITTEEMSVKEFCARFVLNPWKPQEPVFASSINIFGWVLIHSSFMVRNLPFFGVLHPFIMNANGGALFNMRALFAWLFDDTKRVSSFLLKWVPDGRNVEMIAERVVSEKGGTSLAALSVIGRAGVRVYVDNGPSLLNLGATVRK